MTFFSNLHKGNKLLFIVWFSLIILVSLIPQLQIPKMKAFDSNIRLDYFIHFIEYFILSIFFMLGKKNKKSSEKYKNLFQYTTFGLCIAFIGEVLQVIVPRRTFNKIDVLFNFAGFILGVLFIKYYQMRVKKEAATLNNEKY